MPEEEMPKLDFDQVPQEKMQEQADLENARRAVDEVFADQIGQEAQDYLQDPSAYPAAEAPRELSADERAAQAASEQEPSEQNDAELVPVGVPRNNGETVDAPE